MAVIIKDPGTFSPVRFSGNRVYVYTISAIAALGGVLFGFDLAIISGTISFFSKHFQLNEYSLGWAVGCINIGAAIGALIAGPISDRIGRKRSLLICAFLFAITGIGTGWALDFPMFIAFRILSGVAIGAAALVCPVYIAEISPAPLRGRMVAFYQLAITAGILLAYLSNYCLLHTGINNWRWMFSSQAVPSVLFLIGLLFVSESPRWLIGKSKEREGIKVLEKIGDKKYAEKEYQSIRGTFVNTDESGSQGLFRKNIVPILILGIGISIFSQAGGQNSVLSYAPEIFKQAGMAENSAFLQSVLLGLILSVFTFIAIGTIDKAGRKNLLMYGALLLAIDAFSLGLAFYFNAGSLMILILVLAFIAIYAATLGPVTWVVLSEVFPNRVRGKLMSLATLTLWIANFFTVSLFPIMKSGLGIAATFGIQGLICLVYFVFVYFRVPETKGKSLEEIESLLTKTPAKSNPY